MGFRPTARSPCRIAPARSSSLRARGCDTDFAERFSFPAAGDPASSDLRVGFERFRELAAPFPSRSPPLTAEASGAWADQKHHPILVVGFEKTVTQASPSVKEMSILWSTTRCGGSHRNIRSKHNANLRWPRAAASGRTVTLGPVGRQHGGASCLWKKPPFRP
jgi:hypothetical protein